MNVRFRMTGWISTGDLIGLEYKDGVNYRGDSCSSENIENTMFGSARHIVLIEDLLRYHLGCGLIITSISRWMINAIGS